MFCTDCGKALDVGTRVCPNCNALTEEIMDEVTSDVDNSDLRQSKHEFVAEAQISQDANLQRNMETSRPQAIAFGDVHQWPNCRIIYRFCWWGHYIFGATNQAYFPALFDLRILF